MEEADGGVTVTVQRVGGGVGPVSVTVQTADQSATAGLDYTALTTTLAWADGETAPKTVIVPIINDTLAEPDETFQVRLLNPVGGAALGALAVATVNLADNDTMLPPEITAQPQDAVTELNQSATFTVTARGSAPRTFQWRKNGANLPGATSRTLTLSNVQNSAAAIYSVRVSNPFGFTDSTDAKPIMMMTFLRLPALNSCNCLTRYSGCCCANLG